MQPLVSIIVPVYRPGKYLIKCLDSLVCQSLEHYEVLCIDNGSTDGSSEILNDYVQRFPDIFSVYKIDINRGEWPARQMGIKAAKAKYIGFCDSDDYVHKDMFKALYLAAEQSMSDVVVCAFERIHSATGKPYAIDMAGFGDKTVNVEDDYGSLALITPTWWNKIYSKKLIEQTFSLTLLPRLTPDLIFYVALLPHIKKITYVSTPLYHYMVHPTSVTNNISLELLEEAKKIMVAAKKQLFENEKNLKLIYLIDLIAFVHFGVALQVSIARVPNIDMKVEIRKSIEFLDQYFSTWRNSEFLSMKYILMHNKRLMKPLLARLFLKIGIMPIFISVYRFITKILKIDIKW